MSKRTLTLIAICVVLLLVGAWAAHRVAFDWHSLRVQLHSVSWTHVGIGIACIYATFWLRAIRWAVLLGPQNRIRGIKPGGGGSRNRAAPSTAVKAVPIAPQMP